MLGASTERLHFHFSLSCIGEGNGNPLQCSCLENPRDGGAWWAAVCGVAQSPTRLKRLSSSSSSTIKDTMYSAIRNTESSSFRSFFQFLLCLPLLLLLSHFSHVRLLCDPIDGSPPGSPIPGILQARILEWVAISFSNA